MNKYSILFEIHLNPLNYLNKFFIRDVSYFPDEDEVLLYPYFTFEVKYLRT